MIPAKFTGVWERESIALGDAEAYEDADVVWLQAGEHFADIRIPRSTDDAVGVPAGPPQDTCFGGRTAWREAGGGRDHVRWIHEIDLRPWPTDEGTLWFEGDRMLESGRFTLDRVEVPYLEVWRRMPGSDSPWFVLAGSCALMVVVGGHCLTLVDGRGDGGEFQAAYRQRTGDCWTVVRTVGDDSSSLPEPPADPATGVDASTCPGAPWSLVASSAPL